MLVESQPQPCTKTPWPASLILELAKTTTKTAVVKSRHSGPLRIQRPFYPESDTCHLYLLHPPGGLASGDQCDIQIHLHEQAQALITSPGATKFYRSSGQYAALHNQLHLDAGAVLEWLPHETIFFNAAHARVTNDIYLAADSVFIGWEMNAIGRPVNHERFIEGRVESRLRLFRCQELLLYDTFRITSPTELDSNAGLKGYAMQATLIATPFNEADIDSVRQIMSITANQQQIVWGVTCMDNMLVVRLLAHYTETVRKCFEPLWAFLRPLMLNKAPVIPRIWNT